MCIFGALINLNPDGVSLVITILRLFLVLSDLHLRYTGNLGTLHSLDKTMVLEYEAFIRFPKCAFYDFNVHLLLFVPA